VALVRTHVSEGRITSMIRVIKITQLVTDILVSNSLIVFTLMISVPEDAIFTMTAMRTTSCDLDVNHFIWLFIPKASGCHGY
jgi:hypothetical protein